MGNVVRAPMAKLSVASSSVRGRDGAARKVMTCRHRLLRSLLGGGGWSGMDQRHPAGSAPRPAAAVGSAKGWLLKPWDDEAARASLRLHRPAGVLWWLPLPGLRPCVACGDRWPCRLVGAARAYRAWVADLVEGGKGAISR
jgi:hypothetical protein